MSRHDAAPSSAHRRIIPGTTHALYDLDCESESIGARPGLANLYGAPRPGQSRSATPSVSVAGRGPQVSAVMPFWNGAPRLAEAIETVRAQTYSEWELLLIDDGSTNGNTEIAQRFTAQDSVRIPWIDHRPASRELTAAEFGYYDPAFPLVVTARTTWAER